MNVWLKKDIFVSTGGYYPIYRVFREVKEVEKWARAGVESATAHKMLGETGSGYRCFGEVSKGKVGGCLDRLSQPLRD